MYSPDDIVGFACAFFGCLFAGIVPVPIHPPIQKDVSSFNSSSDLKSPTLLQANYLFCALKLKNRF